MRNLFLSSNRKAIILSLFVLVTVAIIFQSCEKEIHIHLNGGGSNIVIQGQIETGAPPYVLITTTQSFFSTIDLTSLQNSFVHGANVTVSDGVRVITLREYALDSGKNTKFFVYTIDSADKSSFSYRGEIAKSYTLNVNVNGQTYTSVTKIPYPITIDSLTVKLPTLPDKDFPNEVQLYAYFRDPDTLGNYAKYFTQRNSEPFYASNIYSDEIVNGAPVQYPISPGYNIQTPDSPKSYRFFKGDTVTVKWSSIDKPVYNFWRSFQYAQNAAGNPFASPINVQSNINNNALGVWAGYGNTQVKIIIPN